MLAGTRPGGDPFAQGRGLPYKALVPAGGVPLLRRVIDSLRGSQQIEDIVISGMAESGFRLSPPLAALLEDGDVRVVTGANTPASSVLAALDDGLGSPVLVTTGDHALLSPAMVEHFCRGARDSDGADVVVGVVDADLVRARYPQVQRTFTPFRDGTYKGTNLFALMTPASRRAPELWVQVEQYRKQPWRMISFLGPMALLQFLLRRLTLRQAVDRVAAKMGLSIALVQLPFPEAALDVDSEAHLRVAEEILRGM